VRHQIQCHALDRQHTPQRTSELRCNAAGRQRVAVTKQCAQCGREAVLESEEEANQEVTHCVAVFVSPDEHTFEMLLKPDGGAEQSMMVVTYRRAK
jgi:uncharacterized OB-fold protein